MYRYVAKVHRVIDGDTVDLIVDLGFTVSVLVRFRLAAFDAPELKLLELAAGKAAKAHLESLFADAATNSIRVESLGRDKYGRWVANITYTDATSGNVIDVSRRMVADGHGIVSSS